MPSRRTNNRRPISPAIKKFAVCVVGGAGHVGAPLAMVMAAKGLPTLIYDINSQAMKQLALARLPFCEEGGEALLKQVLADGLLSLTENVAELKNIPYIVLTVGTPIDRNALFRGSQLRKFQVFLRLSAELRSKLKNRPPAFFLRLLPRLSVGSRWRPSSRNCFAMRIVISSSQPRTSFT